MLSHHELASLLRLGDAEWSLEALDQDVFALRRYRLVEIRTRDNQQATLGLTSRGRELLHCLRGAERAQAAARKLTGTPP